MNQMKMPLGELPSYSGQLVVIGKIGGNSYVRRTKKSM
jgi:hypothetical protein